MNSPHTIKPIVCERVSIELLLSLNNLYGSEFFMDDIFSVNEEYSTIFVWRKGYHFFIQLTPHDFQDVMGDRVDGMISGSELIELLVHGHSETL